MFGRAACVAMSVLVWSVILTSPLAAQAAAGDEWLSHPVDDQTFRTYLDFFRYNRELPFETRVLDTETSEGLQIEHLSFESTPGQRVTARLYEPAEGAARAVIFLHGGAALGKDGAAYPLDRRARKLYNITVQL